MAVELTDYGRTSPTATGTRATRPFEGVYEDHGVYLRALLGQDVDAAIATSARPCRRSDPDGDGETIAAQVLVRLLVRLGRLDEAIDVAAEHLAGVPEGMLMRPGGVAALRAAGQMDRLAEVASAQGDPVRYAAAILRLKEAAIAPGD